MAVAKKSAKTRDKWLGRISDENKAHNTWRKRAEDAEKAYCDYDSQAGIPQYPVFYTTVNLIQGKINGRPPKPDIRKRHPSSPVEPTPNPGQMAAPQALGQPAQQVQPGGMQPQQMAGNVSAPAQSMVAGMGGSSMPGQTGQTIAPVASQLSDDNIISMCLERCLSFTVDTTSFANDGSLAVRDFLITGLGACKVEMETETDLVPVTNPLTMQPLLDEDGQPIQKTVITSQELHLRHFHWSQFRWEPVKDWKQCKWVCFDHYMTKDDVEDRFGVEIQEGTSGPTYGKGNDSTVGSIKPPSMDKYEETYVVHEIWDKRKKMRLFVSECHPEVLEEEEDPLELDNFFPCPPPMLANVNGREMVPNPDYWQYQYLVQQCNTLSARLKSLTEQVKDVKFYDDSFGLSLKKIEEVPDGTFIAVHQLLDKLRVMNGRADTSAIICELDMKNKVEVLQVLAQMLDQLKTRIYEINGIADVQRGVSNPNDTATAQNIKNEWADIRTGQRVQTVALFYRDVFRIMSELIATRFAAPQIEAMSGIDLSDAQIGIMRSDLATAYSIDVESDSTMTVNDSQNVAELAQFMQALEPLLTSLLPAAKAGAIPADLVKEILNLVVDTYKPGRDLQQSVEALPSTLQQLNELTSQAQQAQQQAQQAQQQLQQYQQGEEQRKNAQTQADVQTKGAQAQKTATEAQLLQTDLPKKGADTQKTAAEAAQTAAQAAMAQRENTIQAIQTGIQ